MASRTGPPPNYYAILEVSETATTQQIRDGYKKAALKYHPDRLPADSPKRAEHTRKFQFVNDAYYTLSDASRRREYDAQRRLFNRTGPSPSAGASGPDPFEDDPEESVPPQGGAGPGAFYSWAWNFFTGGNSNEQQRQQAENAQFGDVFEEMMQDNDMADEQHRPTSKFWSYAGGVAGATLGFIAANLPGAVAGGVAGNRFGAIRDARGKSVYSVFQELPQADRMRLLTQLLQRVVTHTVG
ncbi:DnaJ domain-containing protein [Xylariomycetidae sp. FL0641]|nr:DnaJ domain-containing protein [Xylariomycetidae sp. FL0641]